MSRRRRILLAALLLGIAVPVATVAWLLRDPLPHVATRRSEIANAVETERIIVGNSELRRIHIVARSGLEFDVNVRQHLADTAARLPVVVLLGGHVTGGEAARIVGETPGILVVGVSYPFAGDLRPSKLTFLKQIP